MPDTYPDPGLDGGYKHFLPNSASKTGFLGIEPGGSARVVLASAGNGILLTKADGVTPLLSLPETGYTPPAASFVQLTPQAVAPVGITPGAIWVDLNGGYHGLDANGDVSL